MKKITFLIYHQEYAQVLEDIRSLGLLHVIEKGSGELEDESLRELIDKEKRTKNAIRLLTAAHGDDRTPSKKPFNIDEQLKRLDDIIAKRDKVTLSKQSIQKEIEHTSPWGNFKRDSIEQLAKAGYKVEFFTCNLRSFSDEWVEKFNAQIINNIGSVVYFITISKEGADIDAERMKISSKSLETLKSSIKKC
ncbi:MAG: hypothetical protein ACRCZM_08460, partial [Bacteroidales bacterium]